MWNIGNITSPIHSSPFSFYARFIIIYSFPFDYENRKEL